MYSYNAHKPEGNAHNTDDVVDGKPRNTRWNMDPLCDYMPQGGICSRTRSCDTSSPQYRMILLTDSNIFKPLY